MSLVQHTLRRFLIALPHLGIPLEVGKTDVPTFANVYIALRDSMPSLPRNISQNDIDEACSEMAAYTKRLLMVSEGDRMTHTAAGTRMEVNAALEACEPTSTFSWLERFIPRY